MSNSGVKVLDGTLAVLFALFAFTSTFSIAITQSAFAVSLLMFLIVIIIRKYNPIRSRLKIFYLFIGLYVFWMLLAAVLGKTPIASIDMIKEEWLFLIIPVGIYVCENDRYRHWVFRSFAVGVLLLSVYGILQHYTGFHWPKSIGPDLGFDNLYVVRGTFSNVLTFGNYYGTAAAFMVGYVVVGWKEIGKSERWLTGSAALLAAIVTIFSHSRGSMVGLAVSLVIFSLLLKRKWFTVTVVTLLVAAGIVVATVTPIRERIVKVTYRDFHTTDPGGRPFIWEHSLNIVADHPVFGVGEGNFYEEYARRLPPGTPDYRIYSHAHDDLINVAAMSGIPGMLFFLGQWICGLALCWYGWKRRDLFPGNLRYFAAGLAGGLTFFFSSFTEATFADEEVRELLMLVWALGLWQWYRIGRSKLSETKAPAEV